MHYEIQIANVANKNFHCRKLQKNAGFINYYYSVFFKVQKSTKQCTKPPKITQKKSLEISQEKTQEIPL